MLGTVRGRSLVVAALLASSCSSTSPGTGASSTPPASTTRPATTTRSTTAPRPPVLRTVLGRRIDKAIAGIGSVHVEASYTAYGRTSVEHNDVQLGGGHVTALHSTGPYVGGTLDILVVAGKTYIKAPGHSRTPARPWVLASPSDPDTTIANLAAAPTGDLVDDSLAEYVHLAENALSISRPKATGAGGVRYRLLLNNSKTPFGALGSFPNSQVNPLPIDVYLDATGRPVRVTASTQLSGKPASLVLRFSRFNSPMHITAPPTQTVGPS